MKRVVIAGSDILELEMNRMQDENKKQKVLDLYLVSGRNIPYTERIKKRTAEIMSVSRIGNTGGQPVEICMGGDLNVRC